MNRPDEARCLPYPPPYPSEEPEPVAGDLGIPVDWLTYPHPELYTMVHEDVDLGGAQTVAATWATLGDKLTQIGAELRAAMAKASQGWTGASAEKTKETVERLAAWCDETGVRATEVCGCVTRQAENVRVAMNAMPEPRMTALPYPMPADGTAAMSFAGGPQLIADDETDRRGGDELHQRAADVMKQFQEETYEVYGTVPEFSTPTGEQISYRTPEVPPDEPTPSEPEPETAPPDDSTGASGVTDNPVDGVIGGYAPPSPSPSAPVPMVGGGGQVGGAMQDPIAGGRAGAHPGAPGPGAAPAAASAATRGGGTGGMPMGAMPMGAGGQRQEDVEHKLPGYLQEEDNIFAADLKVAPPVLGEEGPRRRA
ncbi:WXG100 family type VII secretion target [Amycolatopsis magusensis]|uniref:WXG100 family type VII secretion target n=1 Tax=Amycolatopsis magusensis TaxID=882444 RepID=UPI003C2DC9D5